jgi:predicted nuclease of restriction endonuclease-like (RecB) superfamily
MAHKKNTPKTKASKVLAGSYAKTFSAIKQHIQGAQVRAALAANHELCFIYWYIGRTIAEQQKSAGWGTSTIERLAKDLQNAFPGIAGFSRTNVFRMKAFYTAYPKSPTAVGQITDLPVFKIPWGHNAVILDRIKGLAKRLWYAQKSIEYGWSRSALETWITSDIYAREGKAITNFKRTLPSLNSGMAQQSLKDPYLFDFLTLHEQHQEKEVEQGLIDHIQKFLLELGQGFAFIGRQVHLQVSDSDYYIDLLFYHFKLRCFIVVELKAGKFDPRDAGQINFYLSAVDDLMRSKDDQPTIGLLLCKTKDNIIAEYALRDINKPIGVASYTTKIIEGLPKNLKGSLPSVEEIETELERLGEKPSKKKAKKQDK